MTDNKECINCKTIVNGEYCHACGQHQTVKPLTWKAMIGELSSKWFGWDNKFLRTIKFLTINPGFASRAYIQGNRVQFIGPLGYLFLVSTIMVLSFQILGVDVAEYMGKTSEVMQMSQEPQTEGQKEATKKMLELISDNFRMISFMMAPFMGLWARLLYRKQPYNLIEHCVLYFYGNGHIIWLTILSIILYKFGTIYFGVIILPISLAYHAFSVISFYQLKQKILGVLKALVLWFLAYVSLILVSMIIGVLYFAFFMD